MGIAAIPPYPEPGVPVHHFRALMAKSLPAGDQDD
jgi:hypothetical protein